MKSFNGIFRRGFKASARSIAFIAFVILVLIWAAAIAQPDTILIGSKSNPEAHLFYYDQKFQESTDLKNYDIWVSAAKEFDECTRLSSNMYLKSNPNWVDIAVGANFSGIGKMGYVVLNQKTLDRKDEMARVSHDFVGNFTIDENILVVKDQMNETGYFGSGMCAGQCG